MSKSLESNVRASVRELGRFFVLWPMRKKLASFLCAQNWSEEGSEKGWIGFFFEKEMTLGLFRAIYKDVSTDGGVGGVGTYEIFHYAIEDLTRPSPFNEDGCSWIFNFFRFTSLHRSL